MDVLIIPIDRWDADKYESIRRGASFSGVVSNAERVLARRGPLGAPTVVVKALDISPRVSGHGPSAEEAVRFDGYWRSRGALPLHGWLNTWAGQMPNLLRLSGNATPYDRRARTACADLWFKAVINWRRELVLCCHNWDYSISFGEAGPGTLRGLWQCEELQRLRRSHAEGRFSCTRLCESCREWGEPDELDAYLELGASDLYKVF